MKRLLFILAIAVSFSLGAQDKTVRTVLELGRTDNRTMVHEDFLANRIGGRIVGSSSLCDAEKWVAEQFEQWGLEVKVQEVGEIGVGFSRGPWFGRMLGGDGMALHFGTPAYTAGTKGPQKGKVLLEPSSKAEFERMKGALKGAWVLVAPTANGLAIDCTEAMNTKRAEAIESGKLEGISVPFYKEMTEAGVLGFIRPGALPLQVLYDRANCFNITMETLPTVCDIILDEHQYATIKQMVSERQSFELEFDIRNHFFRGPVKYHNILGIIKGSKYPDEYVLLGGHLDAYDIAQGAVDDANGVSVTMEAARLLTAAGAKPKRSIMFCIWTAEEYGLLGSKYFVENKTIPYDKISNYFNRDGGPLCASSVSVPEAMYEDFVEICKPLEDYNPDFPFTVNKRRGEPQPRPQKAGGSDHAYFAMNGIPTISFQENDVKGYNFNYREIWHTESDLYDRVIPEYLEHSAVVSAVAAYGLANLSHVLSRDGLYKE